MPQDIPLEASETLAFTPASLAGIEDPPVFRLRAVSGRDRRFMRRIVTERGASLHSTEAIREEVVRGLERLWTPEQFAAFVPRLRDCWAAGDEFALQARDIKAGFDEQRMTIAPGDDAPAAARMAEIDAEEAKALTFEHPDKGACDALVREVQKNHLPLGKMLADNVDYRELSAAAAFAVAIKGWDSLDVARELDRGYLTLECVEAIAEALADLEADNSLPEGQARGELLVACTRRVFLDREEAKNSASPSRSRTGQKNSSNGGRGGGSRSRGSKRKPSTPTPATA